MRTEGRGGELRRHLRSGRLARRAPPHGALRDRARPRARLVGGAPRTALPAPGRPRALSAGFRLPACRTPAHAHRVRGGAPWRRERGRAGAGPEAGGCAGDGRTRGCGALGWRLQRRRTRTERAVAAAAAAAGEPQRARARSASRDEGRWRRGPRAAGR